MHWTRRNDSFTRRIEEVLKLCEMQLDLEEPGKSSFSLFGDDLTSTSPASNQVLWPLPHWKLHPPLLAVESLAPALAIHRSKVVLRSLPPGALNHASVTEHTGGELPLQVAVGSTARSCGRRRTVGETLEVVPEAAADARDVVDAGGGELDVVLWQWVSMGWEREKNGTGKDVR